MSPDVTAFCCRGEASARREGCASRGPGSVGLAPPPVRQVIPGSAASGFGHCPVSGGIQRDVAMMADRSGRACSPCKLGAFGVLARVEAGENPENGVHRGIDS